MRRTALAVAFLLVSAAVSAQNIGPLPPLTAHVDVRVVNVDVSVTDSDGKPVMNLTKDDFELFEDGAPQKITNFYIVQDSSVRDAAKGAAAVAVAAKDVPEEFRRKVLLLVDNNYIEKNERNRALDRIEKYVTSAFGADWAVGTIGQHGSLVQPFTTDLKAVHAAFDRLREMPTFYSQHQIDRSILSDRTRKQLDFGTEYDYKESVRFAGREQTVRNLIALQNTSRAVTDLARAYSGSIGKKSIILLTGGMELNTSFSAYDKSKDDPEMNELRMDVSKIVDTMVREANAANFTVHVINARTREMQAPQHHPENRSSGLNVVNLYRSNWGNEPIDTSNVDSIPLSLAIGTGGMYLPSNDVTESVTRIERQTANFYSLGYSPQHDGDREYHRIRVNVKRPGLRVANRVGYFDFTADDRLEETLRASASTERQMGTLPVTVSVGDARDGDRDMVVPVTAAMSMEKVTLLPRDDGFVGRVHVYLSVFDENGRNIGFHHQLQEVTLPADQLQNAMGQPFRYTMKVHLRKGGAFRVMMTLRDELSSEMGSAASDVRL